jgi:hypothetical protein
MLLTIACLSNGYLYTTLLPCLCVHSDGVMDHLLFSFRSAHDLVYAVLPD